MNCEGYGDVGGGAAAGVEKLVGGAPKEGVVQYI